MRLTATQTSAQDAVLEGVGGVDADDQDEERLAREKMGAQELLQKMVNDYLVETLNLVFGHGQDCQQFWSHQIDSQLQGYFKYTKSVQQSDLNLGWLLDSVRKLCGLALDYDTSLFVGESQQKEKRKKNAQRPQLVKKPFQAQRVLRVIALSEVYRFEGTEIMRRCNRQCEVDLGAVVEEGARRKALREMRANLGLRKVVLKHQLGDYYARDAEEGGGWLDGELVAVLIELAEVEFQQ